jgi:hypothetical protein
MFALPFIMTIEDFSKNKQFHSWGFVLEINKKSQSSNLLIYHHMILIELHNKHLNKPNLH